MSGNDAVLALDALEQIHSILLIYGDGNIEILRNKLNQVSEENEYAEFFSVLGSFFITSEGYSYTDLFLDSFYEKISEIEGKISAYKFASVINPNYTELSQKKAVTDLYNKYNDIGVTADNLLPENNVNFILLDRF